MLMKILKETVLLLNMLVKLLDNVLLIIEKNSKEFFLFFPFFIPFNDNNIDNG